MLAVMFVFAASLASAQNLPPGKWWQRPEIVRHLGLTNEQQDKLDEIFRGAANGLIDAKGDVEKLQIALRGELDRPQLRRADVLKVASQLGNARAHLFELELTMLMDMRSVLTDQQWNQVRDVLDRPRDMRPMPKNRQPGPGPMRPRPQ